MNFSLHSNQIASVINQMKFIHQWVSRLRVYLLPSLILMAQTPSLLDVQTDCTLVFPTKSD